MRALCLAVLLCAGACFAQVPAGLPLRDGMPTLAPVLDKVTPAVVNIAVLQKSPEDQNPLLRDPFFRRFFGLPGQPSPQIAAGSGVIIDARHGYVITNTHVVKEAREVAITLKDNRRFPAKIVGVDPPTDIALLKIEAKNLVEAKWGDSDALQVGDFVIAIGNPFGVGQTATSGIVSALGRSGINVQGYEHFIQTDAPINPGNSGGALVNLKGELIGINTAIIGPSGGNVGIGFAVPSFIAQSVIAQLAKSGEVKRGRLGIAMEDARGAQGAVITEVQPGSPAAQSGIRKGDLVTAFNGRPIRGSAELRARLGVQAVGQTVELRVQRGAEAHTVKATIADVEKTDTAGQAIEGLGGATFAETLRGANRVVLVAAVQPGGPAFEHGLRAGDLIVGVNQRRIGTLRDLVRALHAQGALTLNVLRGDTLVNIPIRQGRD